MALGQMGWLKKQGLNTFDSIQCIIEWQASDETYFVQTLSTGWVDPSSSSAMSQQKIKFFGTEGVIESDQTNRGLSVFTDKESFQNPNPYFCHPFTNGEFVSWEGYGIDSVVTFLKDVEDLLSDRVSILQLESKRPTFHSCLNSVVIIEAANESLLQNGAWVDVDLPLIN